MNELITVILPIYKVEKYLRACVDSVLAQTYSNLEVILVDDKSTDGSQAIYDKYASDARFKIFYNDKNTWKAVMDRAMKSDNSWDRSADLYLQMYNEAMM